MPVVMRAQFAYLLRHPWQLAMAVLGVLAGVAVMVAVDVANQSARTAFLLSMDAVTGEATHQIIGGPRGVDETIYRDLRVEHGIRGIAPVVEGEVDVGGANLTLLGVDPFAERDMRAFTSTLFGDAPGDTADRLFRSFLAGDGAVAMTAATADALGLSEGGAFELSARGVGHAATLLAVIEDDAGTLDNVVITDVATAQVWLDRIGYLTRIDARLSDEEAVAAVAAKLPANVTLLSAPGRTQDTADLSAAFMTNLTAMSLLALLVGLFLIYNSVSFSVLQRRPLIGTLRALGVTRRGTLALLLAEAGTIGLIASSAGVVTGVWLGEQLLALVAQSINDLYFRVSVTEVSVASLSVVKGVGAGTAAAIVAAAVPAIEAAGFEPRLAMHRSVLEQRSRRLLPLLLVLGAATVLVAAAVLVTSGRSLVAGLAAVFMLILGFAMFVPPAVKALARLLAPAAERIGGTIGRIAVADVSASLSRTGVAIVALAVAVSATIGVQVMVDSFRASVSDWLDQSLRADIYVGARRGTLEPALIEDLGSAPGIKAVSTRQRVWLEDEAGRTQLLVIRMVPEAYGGTDIIDADPAEVWPAYETRDVVLVSEPYAYMNDVRVGDAITLTTDRGPREFQVAATYRSYDVNASAVLMSRATYDRHWDDSGVDALGLYLDDGVDAHETVAALQTIAAGRQQVDVNSNVSIRELSLEIFDRTFRITDVLYWLTLGVAFIGILGAMLALQLERGRELATLRALGVTPRQLGSMITTQTGVIGLMSGLAAIPLGLVMAWVLIEVINRRAFGWQIDMRVMADILFSTVAFAIVAAMLAGLYPAWRASQSQPALAMREE